MDFKKEIEKLKSAGLDGVKSSPDLRQLLYKIYGALFLENGQPASCGSKDEMYYVKVVTDGLRKADKYQSVANRTLIFRSSGKIYLPKAKVTFNFDLIDDDKAIELLNKGWISRQAFIKMPDGYEERDGKWVKTEEKDMEDLMSYVKDIKNARAQEGKPVSVTFTEVNEPIQTDYMVRLREMVEAGLTSREIADELNAEGFTTKKGKAFTVSAVNGLKASLK